MTSNLIIQSADIILASSSKIRRHILADAGLEIKAVSPDFNEELAKESLNLPVKDLALHLAREKALSISRKKFDAYVIGSDQVCSLDEIELPKSKDADDAINQLQKLNGKIHYQNNAVVVAFNGEIVFENLSVANMTMRQMDLKNIRDYVIVDQPIGCAGSYKYESLGKHLFKKVEGDYYSVLGLAIQPLLNFFYQKNILKF